MRGLWLVVVVTACGGNAPGVADDDLPPTDAAFDYQVGAVYAPSDGVAVVSRDRLADPAPGRYNICYVNGFQIKPTDAPLWGDALVLRDAGGAPVIDAAWNEVLVDVRTDANRAAAAAIVDAMLAECQTRGYDAIELDNLDSFTRSDGLLTEDHAVAMMRAYADAAHARGLPIAQKNAVELVGRKAELATDFVITEECNEFGECDDYVAAYGDQVLVIEYVAEHFATGCARFPQLSIVLRDPDLVAPAHADYVFDGC